MKKTAKKVVKQVKPVVEKSVASQLKRCPFCGVMAKCWMRRDDLAHMLHKVSCVFQRNMLIDQGNVTMWNARAGR